MEKERARSLSHSCSGNLKDRANVIGEPVYEYIGSGKAEVALHAEEVALHYELVYREPKLQAAVWPLLRQRQAHLDFVLKARLLLLFPTIILSLM